MITNLWLLNLYLAAHVIIIIATFGMAWLYYDLHKQERKVYASLLSGIGYFLLGSTFVMMLFVRIFEFNLNEKLELIPLTFGIIAIVIGYTSQKIPGKPKIEDMTELVSPQDKADLLEEQYRPTSSNTLPKLFLVLGFIPISFIQSLAVVFQLLHKINYGKSKEYITLMYAWVSFTIFTVIFDASIIGREYLVWLDVKTRDYSVLWIVSQLMLIITGILILRWISVFLSFRIFARLFFSIWQWSVYLTIITATAYSLFMIKNTEDQITSLLDNNAGLVSFTLDQIKSNNIDLLNSVANNERISNEVRNKDHDNLELDLGVFLKNNQNLDRIIVTDRTGVSVYDSDRPREQGISYSSNPLIKEAIINKQAQNGFIVEDSLASANSLNYEFSTPVLNSLNEVTGAILNVKRLDDNFIDLLHKQTKQEIIIYVEGKRSASSLVEDDNLSRLENLPIENFKKISLGENEIQLGKTNLLTKPYYVSLLKFKDITNTEIADLVIGTEQSMLIRSSQRALYNIFLLSLGISILVTIPSYYLARSIKKNFSV